MNEQGRQMMMADVAAIVEQSREEQYHAFTDKFKMVKTTDDCYTPPEIYDVVADWVWKHYFVPPEKFIRPFRLGGDYQKEKYPEGFAVVDNPPFSILSKIVRWYCGKGVPFFLFAPTLTVFQIMSKPEIKNKVCILLEGASITYENGAKVNTSFVTNMDNYAVRIYADLRERIETVNKERMKTGKNERPQYVYHDCVMTGKDYQLAKYGQNLYIKHEDCRFINALDAQKEKGVKIFGGGLLLSERAAAERAAAERAAAERAAAERAAAEGKGTTIWMLSDREKAIIQGMGKD